jgi:hypothetical protein
MAHRTFDPRIDGLGRQSAAGSGTDPSAAALAASREVAERLRRDYGPAIEVFGTSARLAAWAAADHSATVLRLGLAATALDLFAARVPPLPMRWRCEPSRLEAHVRRRGDEQATSLLVRAMHCAVMQSVLPERWLPDRRPFEQRIRRQVEEHGLELIELSIELVCPRPAGDAWLRQSLPAEWDAIRTVVQRDGAALAVVVFAGGAGLDVLPGVAHGPVRSADELRLFDPLTGDLVAMLRRGTTLLVGGRAAAVVHEPLTTVPVPLRWPARLLRFLRLELLVRGLARLAHAARRRRRA